MNRVVGAVGLVAAAGLAWGLAEAQSFVVRQVSAPVLAPGSRPVRILHVSDLHLTPGQRRKVEWVRSLASFKPDLVINTGDNLAHLDAVPTALDALEPLLDFPGVFVHGSNDYYAPRPKNPFTYFASPTKVRGDEAEHDVDALTAGMADRGWLNLNNSRGTLTVMGTEISFVGLDDPHLERDALPTPGGARGDLRIGVVHAPYLRALGALHGDGAEVLIAGHTHGGQVCVPFMGALVTNCDLDTSRASGLHGWPGPRPDAAGGEDSAWLHVSAGVGTSPYAPVRFACRPEATVLTLLPRDG
ncbi:metallophosphoesterase family protein [Demequina sp. B12]|uniref:metallophosphoesterase n=1 Tax=Demequina sp. B12 TaxID=2992757 RepID=UPI00237C2B85|nr:metallophosphoesterase [Demequina sp. B12]MDE0572267.1 metallophosphoesterase family protein [Demequina sp. B12]